MPLNFQKSTEFLYNSDVGRQGNNLLIETIRRQTLNRLLSAALREMPRDMTIVIRIEPVQIKVGDVGKGYAGHKTNNATLTVKCTIDVEPLDEEE